MPTAARTRALRRALRAHLRSVFDTLFLRKAISRRERLKLDQVLGHADVIDMLAEGLYGPTREATLPGTPTRRLVRLSVKELGAPASSLIVFEPPRKSHRHRVRCLVGHRFTPSIEKCFRWNLRQICELYGIDEQYSGFDGAAVNLIEDLATRIRTYDFCLFDNRETSRGMKPNVYIEAGMAFAYARPFIFCHYKREVWPVDFGNLLYLPYASYGDLFQRLAAALPLFLAERVPARPARMR